MYSTVQIWYFVPVPEAIMTTGPTSMTTPMSDNEDHLMRYGNYHRIPSLGWNVSSLKFGDAFHTALSWIEHAIRMIDKTLIKGHCVCPTVTLYLQMRKTSGYSTKMFWR